MKKGKRSLNKEIKREEAREKGRATRRVFYYAAEPPRANPPGARQRQPSWTEPRPVRIGSLHRERQGGWSPPARARCAARGLPLLAKCLGGHCRRCLRTLCLHCAQGRVRFAQSGSEMDGANQAARGGRGRRGTCPKRSSGAPWHSGDNCASGSGVDPVHSARYCRQ